MKNSFLFYFLPLGLMIGCDQPGGQSQQQQDPPRQESRESGNPVTAPADYVGAVLTAQQSASVRMAIVTVNEAVKGFQAFEGRLPRNLDEVEPMIPGGLPDLPTGLRFKYNPETGEVTVPR